jgi:hypothetical protein
MELITPTDFHVLWWGLQLYRPEMAADAQKLQQAGERAVSEADRLTSSERIELAKAADHAGLPMVADRLARGDEERLAIEAHRKLHQAEDADKK